MITLNEARRRYEHDPEAARLAAEEKAEKERRRAEARRQKEAREQAALEEFEGALGERKAAKGSKLAGKLKQRRQERNEKNPPKFEIVDGGQDAILNFGRHSGKRISELSRDREGLSYLSWMAEQKFPAELLRIVESWAR